MTRLRHSHKYQPRFTTPTAQSKAIERWNLPDMPCEASERTNRMISALRRLPGGDKTVAQARQESRNQKAEIDSRDWGFHRRRNHAYQNELRCKSCQTCKGTAEVTVDDGYGGVDFEPCPRCQIPYPHEIAYPVAGDSVDVQF